MLRYTLSMRPFQSGIVRFVVVSCLAATSVAQMNMAGHDMGAMKEIPAPEKLPVPVKMTGIGNSHLAITAKPEAQVWFDQGLNLLHDFWDYESVKAFEQAVRVDPDCAMCYWGLYQALIFRSSDANAYADQALANAVRLKRSCGEERAALYRCGGCGGCGGEGCGAGSEDRTTRRRLRSGGSW